MPGRFALYAMWHDRLNARAATKVSTALYRLEQGNFSNTKLILALATGSILEKMASVL
jgi:putative component of toxin-antitoxin plasmid stabilization module